MTREERVALHKKQDRVQVKSGTPNVSDLKEGVPSLRKTSEGVVEYVRDSGVLYKKALDRVSGTSSTAEAASSTVLSILSQQILQDGFIEFKGESTTDDGLMIQWGRTSGAIGTHTVTFPTPFPNAIFVAVCSGERSGPGGSGYNHVNALGLTGMQIIVDSAVGFWLALGH